jgi:hypothetical protein
LRRTALTAITIERNETSKSPNANSSTKANTFGTDFVIDELKSADAAVPPVTAYSTSST